LILDRNLGDPIELGNKGLVSTGGICQAWLSRLDNIKKKKANDPDISPLARVTGPPLLIIRQPTDDPATIDVDESKFPTRGTVLFTVYDPGNVDASTGFCVGTSFVIQLDFEQDINPAIPEDCQTGSATAQVIKIGIGFITLTAGPTSPILALSGIGFKGIATLQQSPLPGPTPTTPNITVLSWQELSCDY
jgi:hypothetical protein